MSRALPLAIGCAGIIAIGAVSGQFKSAPAVENAIPDDVQTTEDLANNLGAAREASKNASYVAATEAATMTKTMVNDPDSVRFESVRVSDDNRIVCVAFRAANGFGGMRKAKVVYQDMNASTEAASWNSKCLGPMVDQTNYVD